MTIVLVLIAALTLASALYLAYGKRFSWPYSVIHPDRDRGSWAPPGGGFGWLLVLLVILAILFLIGIRVNVG